MPTAAKDGPHQANGASAGIQGEVRAHLATDPRLSQEQVATEAGISATTLSLYLSGTYKASTENVERKLRKWLAGKDEREEARALIPAGPGFVATETSTEAMNALRYAQALPNITAIMGVPGVGKTETCREYQNRYSSVWIASMASHSPAVVPVLQRISRAVGALEGRGAAALADGICEKIDGTAGLLIIDEAHHPSIAALDAIRAIHDDTKIGIALVGDLGLADKLGRMPQLDSRVAPKLYRRRPLKEDVHALVKALEITDKRQSKFLLDLVRDRPGALRTLTQVVRLARAVAQGQSDELTVKHLENAAAALAARSTREADHA